jgi:branched-chain amino acid aminotransferase
MDYFMQIIRVIPGKAPVVLPVTLDQVTMNDVTRALPGGAYTTLRTYEKRKFIHLDSHFDRLEESARIAGHSITLDRAYLRRRISDLIAGSSVENRLRIIVDLYREIGDIYMIVEPLEVPSLKQYANGVDVAIINMTREKPKAKLTTFLSEAGSVRETLGESIHEVIMETQNGFLLEGLSSNFFVVKDRQLITPEKDILSGTTRSLVIEIAQTEGIDVHLCAIHKTDIQAVEEAFITSVSRGILPVVRIDDRTIGNGKPGTLTRQLMVALDRRIKEELKEP